MINYFKITNFLGNMLVKGDHDFWLQAREIPILQQPAFLRSINVRYEADSKYFDYMQRPDITLKLKTADCDDFSRYYCDVARYQGYDAAVYADWKNNHAYCIVKITSQEYLFSNTKDPVAGFYTTKTDEKIY